ncbi:NiFe hydrogenase [Shewanella sp. Scap07]|uniref:Kae1-like domain-containing protein n=1 Tax=Shewanella sp. Scap07 TaxID=2589987 RepID=UPI0015C0D7DC|nr:NiFe hydrogenase [Shewanella sp. Scap07]QLE85764.1 NiFe hydrogenase [Shewanella sp. Scap07]
MNIVKFEFVCSRPVPLYAYLCNQYLDYPQLDITINVDCNRYVIEASGEQQCLEQLADDIATHFLMSVWLQDSSIALIEQREGSQTAIPCPAAEMPFCEHCMPRFGDNQHAEFGQIGLVCTHCHGEQQLADHLLAMTTDDLAAISKQLITNGQIALTEQLSLSMRPIHSDNRPALLVCNPNTINAQFHLSDRQVLALSSIEKPYITARPIDAHPQLKQPLYDLCFASDRLLVIITEMLRQQGLDWVFIDDKQRPEAMAFIDNHWVEVNQNASHSTEVCSKLKPLHDQACIALPAGKNYLAKHQHDCYQVARATTIPSLKLNDEEMARCAFNSVLLEHQIDKNAAQVFFSRDYGGQIHTLDSKKQSQLFFAVPELPLSGYEIYHQLEQSPQQTVLHKFKQQFPHDYLRLLDLKLTAKRNSFSSLLAVSAVILGLETDTLDSTTLSDALIAAALSHRGPNAPRVDFSLTRGEAHRSLNWCRMLGSLISFRLADDTPNSQQKLAFGIHDSFADYLANWIEHLDQNVGVKHVAITGNDWQNSMLAQRVQLRVGKNFKLITNQMLELEGNNYAVGALRLNKRRL